jgi:hypothetical protein
VDIRSRVTVLEVWIVKYAKSKLPSYLYGTGLCMLALMTRRIHWEDLVRRCRFYYSKSPRLHKTTDKCCGGHGVLETVCRNPLDVLFDQLIVRGPVAAYFLQRYSLMDSTVGLAFSNIGAITLKAGLGATTRTFKEGPWPGRGSDQLTTPRIPRSVFKQRRPENKVLLLVARVNSGKY